MKKNFENLRYTKKTYGKSVLMTKETKIRWPNKYYVGDMCQYIRSIETLYFGRRNINLSRNYEN